MTRPELEKVADAYWRSMNFTGSDLAADRAALRAYRDIRPDVRDGEVRPAISRLIHEASEVIPDFWQDR